MATKIEYLLGFKTGALLGVISDTHRIRSKPEVNFSGRGPAMTLWVAYTPVFCSIWYQKLSICYGNTDKN